MKMTILPMIHNFMVRESGSSSKEWLLVSLYCIHVQRLV